jgi:hypothetical protein
MAYPIKIILVSSVLVAAAAIAAKTTTARRSHESPLIVTEATSLDLWIEKLAYLESRGREDVQIIDSNGKWSRGCLQFQDETWKRYTRKYGIEATILDCNAQKRLAKEILLHEREGWRNWFTSVSSKGKGLGLPPI